MVEYIHPSSGLLGLYCFCYGAIDLGVIAGELCVPTILLTKPPHFGGWQ